MSRQMVRYSVIGIILLLAVVILLLAGAAVGRMWDRVSAGTPAPGMGPIGEGMIHQRGMMEAESEFDYLAQMIPHHEEAIQAAQVLLAGTDRSEMQAFAEDIIETQTAEVAQMREWLATWYPDRDPTVDYQPMMRDLEGLSGDELDQAFLEDMIPHHMGAVMMSQQLLAQDLAEHPEVVSFAQEIRDAQMTEIQQMVRWLADWFGETPMGPEF